MGLFLRFYGIERIKNTFVDLTVKSTSVPTFYVSRSNMDLAILPLAIGIPKKKINIRASLNTGLPNYLKEAFPMTIPATLNLKTFIKNNNLHPEWVAGFSTGESNFFIAVQKSNTNSGLSVSLRFLIVQHSRDLLLLESFVNFLWWWFCNQL